MQDGYRIIREPAGPAVVVTTVGGLVHTFRHELEIERFLRRLPRGAERFPRLREAWAKEPKPASYNRTVATVEEALAMAARVAKQGA